MKRVQWNCDKAEIVSLAGSMGRRGFGGGGVSSVRATVLQQGCRGLQGRVQVTLANRGEGGTDQARRQISPDDFHFQRTNYSARHDVRSFVHSFVRLFLPLLQIEARSENARIRPRREIAGAPKRNIPVKSGYSWLMSIISENGDRHECVIKRRLLFLSAVIETVRTRASSWDR